jgi:hypothetical protein
MSTTALFIELLITGLQAAIWLVLLVLCLLGFDWINPERLKGFEAMIAVLLLPILYPTGIFIDYLADLFFRRWELKIRIAYNLDETQTAVRLLMQTKDPSLAAHFGYIRSRIRISRSSALNFALITIMGLAFTAFRCRNVPGFPFWRTIFLEASIGASLSVLAALAWCHINHSFHKWVVKGFTADAHINETKTTEESLLEMSMSSSDRV